MSKSDWNMWSVGRPDASKETLKQMADAGVTNIFLDTENVKTNEELRVTFYLGEMDGKPVVQVDGSGDFRVNVNDAPVFDRHTESEDPIYRAALQLYLFEIGWGAGPNRRYSIEELAELRDALIQAGYPAQTIDANGRLEDLR